MDTELSKLFTDLASAHDTFRHFNQGKVDQIVAKVAVIANQNRIDLARRAVEETGMGVLEDKVIKNHFSSEYVYNKYKSMKTCGVVEKNEITGIHKVADSMGIIAAIIPCTNPTSTVIFKTLIALKTRNVVIFCPHPKAKACVYHTVELLKEAAIRAGAPEGLLQCVKTPSVETTQQIMQHPSTALILATGGPGMVHAAYSSGTPSIGVGAGNTPTIIDESANLKLAVSSIVLSKTFDNGVVCASEQSLIVVKSVYEKLKKELVSQGGYILSKQDKSKVASVIVQSGRLNAAIVGQSAVKIAKIAEVEVPETTKLLVAETTKIGESEPFSYEKLSPTLGLYVVKDFTEAVTITQKLLDFSGKGHTAILYTDERNQDRIDQFSIATPTTRILINIPGSQGAIGDIYNFHLEPSLTLGCGSYGKTSVSGNISPKHLLNYKTVAERRENMLWFKIPSQIYFKFGCTDQALSSLKEQGTSRLFIVTDRDIVKIGHVNVVTDALDNLGIKYEVFSDVTPDPTTETVEAGLKALEKFDPDAILAIGGGSPMDAAKIMWLMHDHPNITFESLTMRFMDIRKRIAHLSEANRKTKFIAIPTTSGTGSEISPFSVITDSKTGGKYPIADYSLTPDMAIIDTQYIQHMPKSLAAASGFDAITHSVEAMASVMATPFSDAQAKEALSLLSTYLLPSYQGGAENHKARSYVHYAATLAGMAFSNTSLGIGHSIAHKLGEHFHIPHGVACSLVLPYEIEYNAVELPTKLVAFPQYKSPKSAKKYAQIADLLNLKGKNEQEKTRNLIRYLQDLKQQLSLPSSIKELGIAEDKFMSKVDHIAEEAFDDQCTSTNPRYPLIAELKALLIQIYHGDKIK